MKKICINCNEEKEHHAKGFCYSCYKKLNWKPKISTCKRCKRKMPIHAKNLCASCYNYIFHSDKVREYNKRKKTKIDLKTYKNLTEKCVLCGFDKIVDIHHLDKNNQNNSKENLIGLCPNHHRMINNYKFRYEIWSELQKLGFKLPLDKKNDFNKHSSYSNP
jgi:ribosomal protein L37E